MNRSKKACLLIMTIWLGLAGLFPAASARAADLPLTQGAGYAPGAYDYEAAQPTAYNWTRQSRFMGNPDHDVKWSFAAGDKIYSTPAIGQDGTFYIGSSDGLLYALDPDAVDEDKRERWSFDTSIRTWSMIVSSPVVGADGTVYIAAVGWYGDGTLYALDPNVENDNERVK
ncbi:PQQ-binding-like beta-propeller repeat protein [Paenibacillus bouchesdurhonensis]|uniref:PQQ-binding-like beta-propeller repeat protein n=1 Tax=Paenibacillus bouchesdurhonensis TaxID=1870990 RepID=UPI000DA5F9C0|nr:PQQ-binding-like beta-propeller repeat protein [Paenibacillus bouchesdurhonensis]